MEKVQYTAIFGLFGGTFRFLSQVRYMGVTGWGVWERNNYAISLAKRDL
jgi:hypothetical protein